MLNDGTRQYGQPNMRYGPTYQSFQHKPSRRYQTMRGIGTVAYVKEEAATAAAILAETTATTTTTVGMFALSYVLRKCAKMDISLVEYCEEYGITMDRIDPSA